MILFIIFVVIFIVVIKLYFDTKKRNKGFRLPANTRQLLLEHVDFYRKLDDRDKGLFVGRVKDFLANTTIRGVDVEVEDLDRILVASGAIILIFAFPDWKYNNLSEVLLYKGTFTKEFSTKGPDRNVLGMVGDGAMHREMILSKPSLRASFQNATDGQNTALHEFAHLIDKADGATDGAPEYLLPQPQVLPWLALVHKTIAEMKHKKHSDINRYGATNDAEFFAVIAEYFFERPDKLKEQHPELYAMLEEMFYPNSKPAAAL
jgi:Mlc titration factor MtfA (ptsG expression regulator)